MIGRLLSSAALVGLGFAAGRIMSATNLRNHASAKSEDRNLHPEMMGDETMEQNLNQRGQPQARITEEDVEAAFRAGS